MQEKLISFLDYMSDKFFKENSFLYLNDHPKQKEYQDQFKQVYRGFDSSGSKLGEIFFCAENIDLIQKQIILTVLKTRRVKIPYQSEERLIIVMRHVFTTYARHLPCDFKDQIKELNDIVTTTVVPDIISAIELHFGYMDKINNELQPIELPIHVSNRKTLPSVTTKWF